jgi:terminase small subunit / prophage DNA-packing protein
MVRAGRGKFALEASVRAYCTHMRETVAAMGRPANTNAPGRQRLLQAQVAALELKAAVQRGDLVPAGAVAREWERICGSIRAAMLRVPKRAAARLPHLTPQDVRAIDAEVRAVLAEVPEVLR